MKNVKGNKQEHDIQIYKPFILTVGNSTLFMNKYFSYVNESKHYDKTW